MLCQRYIWDILHNQHDIYSYNQDTPQSFKNCSNSSTYLSFSVCKNTNFTNLSGSMISCTVKAIFLLKNRKFCQMLKLILPRPKSREAELQFSSSGHVYCSKTYCLPHKFSYRNFSNKPGKKFNLRLCTENMKI